MVSPTPNKGMTYPAHGGAVNAWDTPLNADFDIIDQSLGGSYGITITSTVAGAPVFASSYVAVSSTSPSVTISATFATFLRYELTGTLTQNFTVSFSSVGGLYQIDNASSGAFTVTAVTAAGGSSVGQLIGQGSRTLLIANGVSIYQADNNVLARIYTYPGSPNGTVAGSAPVTAGSATDAVWDSTDRQLFATTTTGTSATAKWQVIGPILPQPQGYLSPTSSVPVITADAIGSTVIYYIPFVGSWVPASNGTALYPYQITSQMALQLASSAIAVGGIYDIFFTTGSSLGSSVGVIGFGPSWSVGGGSVTPGSGARGVGAATTELSNFLGVKVNTNTITLGYGSSTYIGISSGAAIWLGSIYCSSAAGTVTCHRGYGQNRVWGISNGYNKQNNFLKMGDGSSNWNYTSATVRVSNNSTGNSIVVFNSNTDEVCEASFVQSGFGYGGSGGIPPTYGNGIGYNSTNTYSGKRGTLNNANASQTTADMAANYTLVPQMGVNVLYSVESAGGNFTWSGTEAAMLCVAKWRT